MFVIDDPRQVVALAASAGILCYMFLPRSYRLFTSKDWRMLWEAGDA
jgi:hypothetical protein